MKKIIASFIKTTAARLIYHDKIDKNLWIFSSTGNTFFNYNSKYLFKYILENEKEITPRFVINNAERRRALSEEFGEKYFLETLTLKGIREVLKGGVWITSAGLPVYSLGLGRKRKIVNLWHGVPLKKIALDEEKVPFLKRLFFKYIFSNNYTYILTTSKELFPIMERSFSVKENKLKLWGQPRNDVLFLPQKAEEKLRKLIPIPEATKKLILYAPTYRDGGATMLFPFKDFKEEELMDLLEEEQAVMVIRHHLEDTCPRMEKYSSRILCLNEDKLVDIMEVLEAFDLLITDYSSIYIDYLILNRPIIFLPYDKEEYLKERGLNFPYEEVTPGRKPCDFVAFKEALVEGLQREKAHEEERLRVNSLLNQAEYPACPYICREIKESFK